MRKITYLKNAYKTLADYDKDTRKKLVESIDKIPQGDIKKLQGEKYPPLYRLRVGKYRIIYHIGKEETIIVKIDTRGDIYK
ncbi:MAG: type II toxin-antitoxin system RelE family toxin [Ruminiclostridium sp.]